MSNSIYRTLLVKIPKNDLAYDCILQIYINITKNINRCCNPKCMVELQDKNYFAFDGYYCSKECVDFAYYYVSDFWFEHV